MSDQRVIPLTEGQKRILADLHGLEPKAAENPFHTAMAAQKEDAGDQTSIEYSLNVAQSHLSLIASEAQLWRGRAIAAEKRLFELKGQHEQSQIKTKPKL